MNVAPPLTFSPNFSILNLYLNIVLLSFVFSIKLTQDSSRKCSAWKDFRFKSLSFKFLSLVGLVRVCAKLQLTSLSRSGLKVPGGVGVGWWGGGVVEAHFSVQLKPKPS